ncbi:hypothetical protein GGQ85_002111 [Nitrobacter vulgaris]|jgi:hypothetical protein|uniref:hypothetical protein n=1 Tax=Nitrobacter vulgaris TaxID=29421 RepID=UPI00285F1AF2|nr:hypothetical protein [Nitrobacter vulgaris]MDR6304404.1 hypothetical protein [Nitrobacter vulgaris]
MLGTQRPTSRNVFAEASETASYSKRIIAPETRARNPGTPATSARCFEQAMLPRHIAEGIAHQLKEFRIGADDWAAQIDFEDGQMVNEDCKLSLEKEKIGPLLQKHDLMDPASQSRSAMHCRRAKSTTFGKLYR